VLASAGNPARAEVELPGNNEEAPVLISAEAANHWKQGTYEVWLLRGNCRIQQGTSLAQSQEAVLWIDRAAAGDKRQSKVIAYLEGNVVLDFRRKAAPARVTDRAWLGRFFTSRAVEVRVAWIGERPDVLPEIYQRAVEQRNPAPADVLRQTGVQAAQFAAPQAAPAVDQPPPVLARPLPAAGRPGSVVGQPASAVGQPPPPGTRRLRVFPRGDVPMNANWKSQPGSNEKIAVIDQGVTLLIDNVQHLGSVDVSADRMVIWTTSASEPDLTGQTAHDERTPLEIYMEGNVVYREGQRVIYAERMYYDATHHIGTVLSAEMLTPVRQYEGLLRLRAEILQQVDPDHFIAKNAFLTSSRLGEPRYRLQATDIFYEQQPVVDPVSGAQLLDPLTGQPMRDHRATAWNDLLYVGDLPVFYWPVLSADLNDPSYYIHHLAYKNDSVFGTQILTDWNMYQLLGIHHPPAGTQWDLSLDYMSLRGFGYGSNFLYHRSDFFGLPGPTSGLVDFWAISDRGFDNLGVDRPHVTPDADYRDRFLWQHREELPNGFQLTAEVGQISDRNFLQEYFQREWNELKDQTTDVELRHIAGDATWNLFAQARLDDFFTQTEWLPRGDHYLLGQSLVADRLTWFEHTSLGYADFRIGSLPNNTPGDEPVNHMSWEAADRQGDRLITRNEFDWPIELGGMKVVPYVLGELGHWGEDLAGNSLDRAYYQAGIRATLPMIYVDPTVESDLWNVHGLAHKVEFNFEFSQSESNRPMTDLPLYEQLNDNQIEAFERRLIVNTFGSPVVFPFIADPPRPFDERFYALRSGMAGWVTAPSLEIADDLTVMRLGVDQRWQTKRGPPDDLHIIDWIELDTDIVIFPDPARDNPGPTPGTSSVLGLADYNFCWHVGDRLSLVSDGIFDFFQDGQKIVNVGAFLTRPPRGSLYAGIRIIDGPVSDTMLAFNYSYWMSPKWISSLGTTIDLTDTKNVGANLTITRIGESLLISGVFNADPVHNTFGAGVSVEPRFMPQGRLNQLPGAHVPPAGVFGLE
jgi:hypothetical protein